MSGKLLDSLSQNSNNLSEAQHIPPTPLIDGWNVLWFNENKKALSSKTKYYPSSHS